MTNKLGSTASMGPNNKIENSQGRRAEVSGLNSAEIQNSPESDLVEGQKNPQITNSEVGDEMIPLSDRTNVVEDAVSRANETLQRSTVTTDPQLTSTQMRELIQNKSPNSELFGYPV